MPFNEIKNQFGKIIEVFRSENAKEYFCPHRVFFISPLVFTHPNKMTM